MQGPTSVSGRGAPFDCGSPSCRPGLPAILILPIILLVYVMLVTLLLLTALLFQLEVFHWSTGKSGQVKLGSPSRDRQSRGAAGWWKGAWWDSSAAQFSPPSPPPSPPPPGPEVRMLGHIAPGGVLLVSVACSLIIKDICQMQGESGLFPSWRTG